MSQTGNYKSQFHEIMEQLAADIQSKKEAVVMERLKAKGIEFDSEKESIRRFKSIMVESHETHFSPTNTELYFYNDGSEQGLFIVGFMPEEQTFDEWANDNRQCKISASFRIIDENPLKPNPPKPPEDRTIHYGGWTINKKK